MFANQSPRMNVRNTLQRVLLLPGLLLGATTPLLAQRDAADPRCRDAVSYLRETTHAEDLAADAAVNVAEKRQQARAQLVSCGSVASEYAASVISETRSLVDTTLLRTELSSFGEIRDASVFAAALEVAGDRAASVPARMYALRTLLVLSTGSCGRCWPDDSGHDDRHVWRGGTPLPSDAGSQSRVLARRIANDASEPERLRTVAGCVAGT